MSVNKTYFEIEKMYDGVEDAADKFLRDNDDYYLSNNKSKVSNCEYPYLTKRQLKRRYDDEIPSSSDPKFQSMTGN